MPGLQGSLIWYELMTPDAAAAKAFYEAVVGWAIAPMGGDHKGYQAIAMPDGAVGGLLPLTQEMCDHGAKPTWLMYIGVDDVDATVAAIETAGGKTVMPAADIPGIGRFAMLADPQGAPFYIMTPIPPEGGGESTSFSPTLLGRCTWNELRATDLDSALDFYTAIFGWEVAGSMPMGPMGDYKFLAHGGLPIGAAMGGGGGAEQPPYWLHYFRVADIDATVAAVKAGGGEVLNGPHEVPGGDRVIICRDPQGAGVGFVARP
jgi:predicted enzyme related to lactoylglutathione lyase